MLKKHIPSDGTYNITYTKNFHIMRFSPFLFIKMYHYLLYNPFNVLIIKRIKGILTVPPCLYKTSLLQRSELMAYCRLRHVKLIAYIINTKFSVKKRP